MSRTPVTVRVAETTDVPSLRELWGDILRRGALDEQLADGELRFLDVRVGRPLEWGGMPWKKIG